MKAGLGNMANGKSPEKLAAEFTAKLLYGAANIHYLHLMTPSYSRHMALNELYTMLPDMVDKVIEQFQGINPVIGSYPVVGCKSDTDMVVYIKSLYDYVESVRYNISDATHIQNDIDNIQAMFASTLYKVKNLK